MKPPAPPHDNSIPAALIVCLLSTAVIGTGLYLCHSAWTAILLYHGVLIAALASRKIRCSGLSAVFQGYNAPLAVLLVFLSLGLGWGFFAFFHRLDPSGTYAHRQLLHSGLSLSLSSLLPFGLYVSIINPVFEEIYWRGNFRSPHGIVFDLFYALLHLPLFCFVGKLTAFQLIIPVTALVLAGFFWRWLAGKSGGLASSIISHGSGDFALFLAIIGLALYVK